MSTKNLKMKIFFVSLFFCFSFNISADQHILAICAIFQNDVEYLPEWIEFHIDHGVEHFFLYDNHYEPIDLSVLERFVKCGIVEIIPWRHQHHSIPLQWCYIQCSSYMDCVTKNRSSYKWIAFLDTDEFLFSPKKKDLREKLKEYDKFSGVCVNWVMYGTSGVSQIPEGKKMIDLLTYRAPLDNIHIKSIVKPKYVEGCHNMHFFVMQQGHICVTENSEYIYGAFSKNNSVENLRINHYWSRDINFFENKKIPRLVAIGSTSAFAKIIESSMNKEYDPILADTCR